MPIPNRVIDTTLGLPQLALDEIDRRVAQHGTTPRLLGRCSQSWTPAQG